MVRTMLLAGLLLAATLALPTASAGHEDGLCPLTTAIEDPSPEHYVCAAMDGVAVILEPFNEARDCAGDYDPKEHDLTYLVGCL